MAEKHDCRKDMKLGHKALEARWDESATKWKVKLENVKIGEIFEDRGDSLIIAIGALNEWRWPQVPGLYDYGGKLLHSAAWNKSYDCNVSTSSSSAHNTETPIGQKDRRDRSWIERHPNRARLAASSTAPGSLRAWANMDICHLRQRGD